MPAFRCTLPVRFADVDHAGIVYYPKFFDYFHLAFEEFFCQRMGPRAYVNLLDRERIGFPAVSARCDYKAPLRFGDTMEVVMSVERLGARSLTFRYRVYRRHEPRDAGERTLCAEGNTTCAVVDLDAFRAVAIPDAVRLLLEPLLETGAGEPLG